MNEVYARLVYLGALILVLLAIASIAAIWWEAKSEHPPKERLFWVLVLAVCLPFAVIPWAYKRFKRPSKAATQDIGFTREPRATDRFGNFK